MDHPFTILACAFSKAEAAAAGIGDSFGDDAKLLITGTTSDGLTVDALSTGFTGDSVELYSPDLKTVNWISSTSLLGLAGTPSGGFGIQGRHVTWDTSFFDRTAGKPDLTHPVKGRLDVTCP